MLLEVVKNLKRIPSLCLALFNTFHFSFAKNKKASAFENTLFSGADKNIHDVDSDSNTCVDWTQSLRKELIGFMCCAVMLVIYFKLDRYQENLKKQKQDELQPEQYNRTITRQYNITKTRVLPNRNPQKNVDNKSKRKLRKR